ncbi:MAG: serine/threonine protein kinase [Pseudomonadota bacterium]
MDNPRPFDELTPDLVLDAVEASGLVPDGRLTALNSFENRVYQIGLEEASPVIGKFYRPGRWSDAQIIEEHRYTLDLAALEMPVAPPLADSQGATLRAHGQHRFSLFERRGGRTPELDRDEVLLALGRFLGRMHRYGAHRPFECRPHLTVASFGVASADFITGHFIPADLRESYVSLTRDLIALLEQRFAALSELRPIAVHGDCHRGNLLWWDEQPLFLDFDDARMAPAVQDLWMLTSGPRSEQEMQLGLLLRGYEEFHEFDYRELALAEPLRTLRMMHYAAWLARRWDDPAFPQAFPWFNTQRYWEQHILDLREQFAALSQAPSVNQSMLLDV